jgi:hypothetical protein
MLLQGEQLNKGFWEIMRSAGWQRLPSAALQSNYLWIRDFDVKFLFLSVESHTFIFENKKAESYSNGKGENQRYANFGMGVTFKYI